ncbi:MAG TPA: hypothetical protein VK631_12125 [Solirubrobacteraceae bacterium]|nr:hypothetical protein [Solirubrobacteraceae bacterium]
MQDAEVVGVRDGRDEQVDRGETVVADPRELALSVERAPLDVLVDVEAGECQQIVDEPLVIAGIPCRVPGLEEERQARRDAPGLERSSEFSGASWPSASIGARSTSCTTPSLKHSRIHRSCSGAAG